MLATQTLAPGARRRRCASNIEGEPRPRRHRQGPDPRHRSASIGVGGGTGYVVEYAGAAIRALSMEERMTVCNMSIEGGARAGMIAPDETTFEYAARAGRRRPERTSTPPSSAGASSPPTTGAAFDARGDDRRRRRRAAGHLGHHPGHGRAGHRPACPTPRTTTTPPRRDGVRRRAGLHGPRARREPLERHRHRRVSSSAPAPTAASKTCARPPQVVARSQGRRRRARRWSCRARAGQGRRPRPRASTRSSATPASSGARPGCSMCLAMNPDKLEPGRALRLDAQPQLRGPAGQGRPHPPGSARRWPPRPRSTATSSTSAPFDADAVVGA